MRGLMMDLPLLVSGFMEYAAENHGETEIVARELEGDIFRYTYAQAHDRMKRLAMALARLGVQPGMPVGTLAWNTHRHFEMFYGVPGSGAVLHTVNPRLFPDQLVYIINHAEDRVLCLDAVTLPIVEQIAPRLTTVEKYIVLAAEDRMPQTSLPVLCYETLLAQEDEQDFAWPRFDENSASTICFTSGTTGNPKGVVYSHRAAVLQTLLAGSFDFLPGHQSGAREVMMPMAPMFHGNAWNFPVPRALYGQQAGASRPQLRAGEALRAARGREGHDHLRRAELLADPHRLARPHRQALLEIARHALERLGAAAQPDRQAGARLRRRARPGLGHDRGADVDLRVAEARAG